MNRVLTDEAVREIRRWRAQRAEKPRAAKSLNAMCARFGVSPRAIQRAAAGQTHKAVQP